jgi:hypothetical protein
LRPQPEKEMAALSRIPSQRIRTHCEERFMIFGQRNLTVRVASRQSRVRALPGARLDIDAACAKNSNEKTFGNI